MPGDQQKFQDFGAVVDRDMYLNSYQNKKSHVEVLQSGNGHVPSPLNKNDESSFYQF